MKCIFFLFLLCGGLVQATAQQPSKNLVYVDGQGVLRYTKNKQEAAFFGVNYTVPFAYGYRSHKALGVDPEKAIDADVYAMARLGLDAFRVHVWDVEITDSLGNLLKNEHLRLFDYLVKKLKERNIKILVTPIAFWGNGYPEPDLRTTGFSYVYTKSGSVVREEAFKAQENYLKQFFTHVNPYTGLSYTADPDVIAMEINNEPHHSGPRERTTEYVARMAAAVRSSGWTKPVFYNISESPTYAGAVVNAAVDGHSFQWYPTGLVAGREQKGNFLPNVDRYAIPFGDTLAAFKKRALMVYEFDAADIMQPVMYPAMARSFRTAGFQWATQFAYDPVYTAYANTEYQTHFLNLAYTPAKAISLLIASKAFHRLPRGKGYGTYPADTLFDVFRLSYRQQLSEMNSQEEFYYTNNTATQPANPAKLQHLAGVGSSPVVAYEGTGAYFLDKLANGAWRLEVMPDAVVVQDPFEKASPKKHVVQIGWRFNKIVLRLPGSGAGITLHSTDKEGSLPVVAGTNEFYIKPGVYLVRVGAGNEKTAVVERSFFAPPASVTEPGVFFQPPGEVTSGKTFSLTATVVGVDTADKVSVEIRNTSNKWRTVPLQRSGGYHYTAAVPAEMATPGVISYRIMVKKQSGETHTFPGGFKGDPYAWDEWRNETYQTYAAPADSPLELFNPSVDRNRVVLYNPDWRRNTVEYTTTGKPRQLALKATMNEPPAGALLGWQSFFGDKIAGRREELSSVTKLVVRARAAGPTTVKISLITTEAAAFAAAVSLNSEWADVEIPLDRLQRDSMLLLPRPYPGFQPLRFLSGGTKPFALQEAERLQFTFEGTGSAVSQRVEVESVYLKK